MDIAAMKRGVARAALEFVREDDVIGVGSGSTVARFISVLGAAAVRPRAAVAASEASAALLRAVGIGVVGLTSDILPLPLCLDGADEIDGSLRLIKGGGGALTREKVIAQASRTFVCIADESKLVPVLGRGPLPVEVLPMALDLVTRELRELGGTARLRPGITDNGNVILDVEGLDFADPDRLERDLDALPGVIECGVFAHRRPDVVLVGTERGIRRLERS